ncbi:hypothetical protein TNCV_4321791 [Trichonephila clavipes]|uniref:Uncharacterized protein n=1 Tax=Trichonephila clavipes TaxID=2585209 RepID=A0A8X6VKL8_TRICX|nr:hypothetical protein TNCV_4321791 [Trichonephila clavipes]
MNRCPDLVVCLKRDLQCLRPEASLVLIYRPNVARMKGRVDLAQPVNRTPDLCTLLVGFRLTEEQPKRSVFISLRQTIARPMREMLLVLGVNRKFEMEKLSVWVEMEGLLPIGRADCFLLEG